jgi:hypothetical protein
MIIPKKVYLAILNQGEIRMDLVHWINEVQKQGKYEIITTYPAQKPITYNRNLIVNDFLKSNCDFLMMIDDDIVPPLNYFNLVDFNEDIISGVCYVWRQGMVLPLILKKKEESLYDVCEFNGDEGLVDVDAVGTGAIIIKRKVLENNKWEELGGWFVNEYSQSGTKKAGNDLEFCRKAKSMGFNIKCHLDYHCSHWVTTDLKLFYRALLKEDGKLTAIKL